MNVKELIRELKTLNPDMKVVGNLRYEFRQVPGIGYNPKKVVVLNQK